MGVCSGGVGLRMLDHDQVYRTAKCFYASEQQQAEQNIILFVIKAQILKSKSCVKPLVW